MTLPRILCPDCGAGLTSKVGFAIGQAVTCPKCKSAFKVSAPFEVDDDPPPPPSKAPPEAKKKPARVVVAAVEDDDDDDDDDDDRPRKKSSKKRRREDDDDDDGSSYRSSWLRYVILGILVVVMLVLGFMLYKKWNPPAENATKPNVPPTAPPGPGGMPVPPPGPPGMIPGPGGSPKSGVPGQPVGQTPGPGVASRPSAADRLFDTAPLSPSQVEKLKQEFISKLTGTWEGIDSDGVKHHIEYRKDLTFTHTIEGGSNNGTITGTFAIIKVLGDKAAKLARQLGAKKEVNVAFEEGELVHDTGTPGVSVVLRKK